MKDFPPTTPRDLDELERAVMLLGALAKGQRLKAKKLGQLQELIGTLPLSKEQAVLWKSSLKTWRQECLET